MTKKNIVIIDKDIQEIVPTFIENRHKDLNKLNNLVQSKSFSEIKVIGHKMSGNCASYGFIKLGEIGQQLELLANEKNLEEILKQIELFHQFISNIEIKYE